VHSKSALVTAMRGSGLALPIGTVSQYETSNHLCDRLNYADHGITQMAGELIGGCAANR
jgi:hypothetical protein